MKQTVTIEIANNAVVSLLKNLAALRLIKFTSEPALDDEPTTARLNEIYSQVDSSLEPCYMLAQTETLEKEDW